MTNTLYCLCYIPGASIGSLCILTVYREVVQTLHTFNTKLVKGEVCVWTSCNSGRINVQCVWKPISTKRRNDKEEKLITKLSDKKNLYFDLSQTCEIKNKNSDLSPKYEIES